MGITLLDLEVRELAFDINFWHWHAIVEQVRRLNTLPHDVVEGLHHPFCGNGLTKDQARSVALELRTRIIPALAPGERILLDGQRTLTPDDGVLHRDPAHLDRNYSTTREALLRFAGFCEATNGFTVC